MIKNASRRQLAALVLGAPLALAAVAPSQAQPAWPDKPLKVVLPYPPGGPSDIVMRLAAEKMQAALKQPIVIENKPGAGGNLGTAEVARAAPDGHTWLWITDTVMTVNPHVYKNLGFKPDALIPVTVGTAFNQTLVCNPAVGVKTLAELVTKAKAAKLAYASGGAGVPGHLAMELLQSMAGFDMTHVPYKGPAPAMQDVMGGQVACGFLAGPTVLPQVRAGKLVALAVSGSRRSPALPEVPTVQEAGGSLSKFYIGSWNGLAVPAKTPRDVVQRLSREIQLVMEMPEVKKRLSEVNLYAQGSTPEQASDILAQDVRRWGEVITKAKIDKQ